MAAKKNQKKKSKSSQPRTKSAGARYNVDDPVNDVHDDELYDDETGLLKEPPEKEEIERPW